MSTQPDNIIDHLKLFAEGKWKIFLNVSPNKFAKRLYNIASTIPRINPIAEKMAGIPISAPNASIVP